MSKTLSCLVLFTLIPHNAIAQIIPDSSLSTENSVIESNGNRDTITGGATRDANLFHSFTEFNVEALREAYFTNPDGIANIFSRVTGNNISDIQGVLGVLGYANLYLINPNGILFGENARLDVNGSFFATTADSVVFENGLEFSAVNPDAPPLLTIDIPIGLRFRDNPGDITVRGKGNGERFLDSEVIDTQEALRVDSDETISLIGGNLILEDATIKTAGGRIELGSVAGGKVNLIEVADGFTVDYSGVETFRDISLSGKSNIDASGLGGGDIQVAGRNITLRGISAFEANTLGGEAGGDISIFAAESLEISGVENDGNFVSAISNRIFPDGTAEGGDITIETGSLHLGDRALIATTSFGQGEAGDININATESISLASQGNTSAIISNLAGGAIGNGGDIKITTPSLNLSNGAFISSNTSGNGHAGNINIITNSFALTNGSLLNANTLAEGNAGNTSIKAANIVIDAQSNSVASTGIFNNVGSNAIGNAGNIELNTGSLTLNNGATIFASGNTQESGGNITINATGNASFTNGSSIFVTGAKGGSIQLDATNLSITSGSIFFGGITSNSSVPEAQSGDIAINLTEDLVIDGLDSESLTFITNSSFGEGNPGNIDISARNITFLNGGTITSFVTEEQENTKPGDISLNATGDIVFDGTNKSQVSGISNFIDENVLGNIGEINITAQNLTLTNGAQIQSQVAGINDSGDININVADSIKVDGFGEVIINDKLQVFPSKIASIVTEDGRGNAGTINVNTQNLALSRNGRISVATTGQGNAGNINIDAKQITIGEQGNINLNPSNINADNFGNRGNGGDITINTDLLSIKDGGYVSADVLGELGTGGNIIINARDIVSVDGTGIAFNPKTQRNEDRFSGITTDVFATIGNGGNITVNTNRLIVNNDAFISSDVVNSKGNAGDIIISATDSVEVLGGSDIETDVFPDSTGTSGNLTIETGKLLVTEGSQISASTFGDRDAGNLTIRAKDSIELSGGDSLGRSGLFASALEEDGSSGELKVFTQDLIIRDGAIISASNFQSLGLGTPGTGVAGNLVIEARKITLDNDARITTATQAGDQGNITLTVAEDLILRDNSFISAQAFEDATGGNLNIDARFIIAFPNQNNDIISSAEQGDGGKIEITAEALFGIEERPLNPLTNDINASSETGLPGEITIQQPTVDPVSGLLELTQEVVDPAQLIAQNVCTQTADSEFVDIGKGGLPPNPDDVLVEDNIQVGLVKPITTSGQEKKPLTTRTKVKPRITRKPPAQGWIFHENGIVELVAYNPHQVGEQRIWDNYRSCQ